MQEREADDGNLGEVAGEERGARRGREVKEVEAFATSREGRGFPPDLASSVFFLRRNNEDRAGVPQSG